MAISAGEAQFNVIFNSAAPKVTVLPKLKLNDFVLINWDGNVRVAKILGIIDGKVHVRWYLRKSDLPEELASTEEFDNLDDEHEVVECGLKSDNVDKKFILCKQPVFHAYPGDSIAAEIEKRKAEAREAQNRFGQKRKQSKMYVCRFKLVKKTVYRLQPVSWTREEPNSDYESVVDDTCTEDETEACHLNDLIRSLKINERKRSATKHAEADENRSKLVSPIKIVNGNSGHKVKRSTDKAEERTDDVDVSPNKRGKFVNEQNGNYLAESPKSVDRPRSHSRNAGKARKNLNSSFLEVSVDEDNTNSTDEPGTYTVAPVDSEHTVRMTFRKNPTTPLKERHENISDSPGRDLRKKVLSKTVEASVTPMQGRRSILKNGGDSTKSGGTSKRSVKIREEANETESPQRAVATPSKMETRRSTRMSAANANAKMRVTAEDQSPEIVKVRPKTPNTPRTPKTPRSKTVPDEFQTPRSTGRRASAAPKTPTLTPQRARQLFRSGNVTPSVQSRETAVISEQSGLEMIRDRLHVSAVPDSLPCRESEFKSIHSFVKDKINDECGGCIYIAGVPGTGKTATVTQVVRKLQADAKRYALPKFDFVEINGMRLTEPRQAYVQIYRQLTGKTLAWAQARDLLEKRFTDPKSMSKKQTRSTILLIDELDIICNRKQDVVYNLFDWTSKRGSRLVAITIANTMDLPERVLKLKVASRLGLTRITFQPYSFKQLQAVVMARLAGSNQFVSDAVQLVARKVASVSGDCRRALDICRRATEIAEEMNDKDETVKFIHVTKALDEMFASPRIRAIKCCTKFEKLFLQAVASEITRTGIEEVDFLGVYAQLQILAPVLGIKNPPNQSAAMEISLALGASRLLIVEDSQADIYQKIILNVSVDDLYYALNSSQ